MARADRPLSFALSAEQWLEIDRICDRYETDWTPHRSGEINAWIQRAEPELRACLAEELIALDRQLRSAAGLSADSPRAIEAVCGAEGSTASSLQPQTGATAQSGLTLGPDEPREGQTSHRFGTATTQPNRSFTDTMSQTDESGFGIAMPLQSRCAVDLPKQIGKYRVISYLSGGGQGDVFRAVHPMLDREVVIKLGRCRYHQDSPEAQALLREGRILAQLDHLHLVRVYDLDFYEGFPFLVLDFVQGRTLRQLSANGAIDVRSAAQWVAQAARALAEVHRQGLLHLDLKPENILIDTAGRARVIDFGLALLPELWSDDPQSEGTFRGTPAYASPEQASGRLPQADCRTDVFGLGALLFALLTGRPPYQGDSTREVLARAAKGHFDRSLLRGVPGRLVAIVLRAMAVHPEGRYASAVELAEALESFIEAESRSHRRGRWATVAAALVVVAALALAAVVSSPGRQLFHKVFSVPSIPVASRSSDATARPSGNRQPFADEAAKDSSSTDRLGDGLVAQPEGTEGKRPQEIANDPTTEPKGVALRLPRPPSAESGTSRESAVGGLPHKPDSSADESPGKSETPGELLVRSSDIPRPPGPGLEAGSASSRGAMVGSGAPALLHWDRQMGVLLRGDRVIRRVRVAQASNLARLLDAFESAGWPKWLDRPLGDHTDRKTLFSTVSSLNETLDEVRFRVSGEGVEWFIVGPVSGN